MPKLLFFTIILFIPFTGWVQENGTKNSFSIILGPAHLVRQDLIFSPFGHQDFSLVNWGFEFERENRFFQKLVVQNAGFSPIQSPSYYYTNHGELHSSQGHRFNFVDVDYLLGKRIKEWGKSHMVLGVLVAVDVQLMDYSYGRNSSFGYYSTFGAGGFAKYGYLVDDRSNITVALKLPMIAWMTRSPYLVHDDAFIENTRSHSNLKTFLAFVEDGHLALWDQWMAFDLAFEYNYRLNANWGLKGNFQYAFEYSREPRTLKSYQHSLGIGTVFYF